MRLADDSELAVLVLFFLAAHFLLLLGVLIRIVVTERRRMLRTKNAANLKILRRSDNRSASRINDEETSYEANRMHLL
jgi:hypothetical protein